MQGDGCPLRQERLRKPWTQQQLADFAQVSLSTVERAERGDPIRFDNIQRLCACLKKSPEQLGLLKVENDTGQISVTEDSRDMDAAASANSFNTSVLLYSKVSQAYDFIATNMTACFWNLAFNDRCTSDEMTYAIKQAIKEFDIMNADNQNYPVTRREALCQLATLPIITLQLRSPGSTVQSRSYDAAITHCTAAFEGCWGLYEGSDPEGHQYAFQCVSTYVPLLEMIAHDSARLREKALDLAAQYAILQTVLGWQCTNPWETVGYAQNALVLSRESGNILFQLSVWPKLSWTYLTARQSTKALETLQEGEHILKEYQRKERGPSIPDGMISNFYSSYSLAQVSNGINPDMALGIATDSPPSRRCIALVEFAAPAQWIEAAEIYCYNNDPTQAMKWLSKLIDPDTLMSRVPQSERERIETLNVLTDALLQSKDRDMKHVVRTWKAGMKGAQAFKHEVRYQEAITNFERMRGLWRGEDAIRKLMPMTSHW